ncbi:MAG: EamA family transporter [Moorea sp. SIO3C2]|nr:EamA family transporter [Moorena sp. SIO3C2]
MLFYIKAISKGSIAIVSTLSALYPLVVILLGLVVLHETLTLKQTIGIGFALVAIAFGAAKLIALIAT